MLQDGLGAICERVRASGRIEDGDITAVRRIVYADGAVSAEELGRLFEIEHARKAHHREWSSFFREAVVDVALNQTPPLGYVSEANAEALIAAIGERRDARTDTELEALADIVQKAREVPPRFSAFVLKQIKNAVIYSDGVDAQGQPLSPGAVTASEIGLMQRVLWGAEAGGMLAISREEAEALFDIADATTGADNDPAWSDMFARAVGNYLLGATARQAISREAALQAWHTDYESDIVATLTRILRGTADVFETGLGALGEPSLASRTEFNIATDELERARAREKAENLHGEKAEWLVDRIRRNGLVTGPERELLEFVKREANLTSPDLRVLIDQLAEQAPEPPPGRPRKTFGRRTGFRAA
jgi:hypothetical protein